MTYSIALDYFMELWPLKSPTAPRAVGLTDPAHIKFADRGVGGFADRDVAEFVVLGLNHFDRIKARDLTDQLFIALADAFGKLPNTPAVSVGDVILAPGAFCDGMLPLLLAATNHQGRQTRRQIGLIGFGDGSDATDLAHQIADLFRLVPQVLEEVRPKLFVERKIGHLNIVLDVSAAAMFDSEKWELSPVFRGGDPRALIGHDVVNAKTHERLADVILGSDGVIQTAVAPNWTDFRLARISAHDTRESYSVLLTPGEIAQLQAESVRTGRDEGRLLVEGLLKC